MYCIFNSAPFEPSQCDPEKKKKRNEDMDMHPPTALLLLLLAAFGRHLDAAFAGRVGQSRNGQEKDT
eukprot:scaffold22080_cov125-Isochrysis_galbana.AAC.7